MINSKEHKISKYGQYGLKISFIWSGVDPISSGTGGAENYTIGQVRELMARGIEVEIVTVGQGVNDGRDFFPDIQFRSLTPKQIGQLDTIPVFVIIMPMKIDTKRQSYVILHCSPPPDERNEKSLYLNGVKGKKIIVSSNYAAGLWSEYLGIDIGEISVVYPFAETVFSKQPRIENHSHKRRILFANRLSPEKGIYTFLAALHFNYIFKDYDFNFTVIEVNADSRFERLVEPMIRAHPLLEIITPRKSPAEMADLLVNYDIVVVPSNSQFWHETFGIISVEAQHAGCRVVASDDGGLPETDCSGLVLVEPDNPLKLALGIAKAAKLGPLTKVARQRASSRYTVKQSIDSLLKVLGKEEIISRL